MMRVYGRVPVDLTVPDGPKKWVVVTTDANGYNDAVYITALCQTLKLNLYESPFWANYGIPAKQAVQQQVPPDFYVVFIQQFYAQFFAALTIAKVPDEEEPTYDIFVLTHSGAIIPPIRVVGAPQ
jgi:hypothetical protein